MTQGLPTSGPEVLAEATEPVLPTAGPLSFRGASTPSSIRFVRITTGTLAWAWGLRYCATSVGYPTRLDMDILGTEDGGTVNRTAEVQMASEAKKNYSIQPTRQRHPLSPRSP